MHRLAFVLALTGCYRPGADAPCTVECSAAGACPDGLRCNPATNQCALEDGGCVALDASSDASDADAMRDGGLDAPLEPPCTPSSSFMIMPLTQGAWFTPDLDRNPQLAFKIDLGEPYVTEGNADTQDGGAYSLLGPPNVAASYGSARLAPTVDEVLYVRTESGIPALMRAKRVSAGNWSSSAMSLHDESNLTILLSGTEELGAPTATSPRHMLVTTGPVLDEFVETNSSVWTRVRRHSASFTGISFLGRATLTEDGRRMVFRGQIVPANVAGFYTDRANVGDLFTAVATRIPATPSDSVETPYLTDDCHHYYYTSSTSRQIQHVVYTPP